jgi:hypothetical protein
MPLSNWKSARKRTQEDSLLLKYWERVGGIIFTEVFVGKGGIQKWTSDAKPRRIDGVRIVSNSKINGLSDGIITFNKKSNLQEFQQFLSNGQVEIIEIKHSLNRVVLGQVIIGADLLEMEYNLTNVKQVVICEVGDPVLEMVCKKRNIKVWIPTKE